MKNKLLLLLACIPLCMTQAKHPNFSLPSKSSSYATKTIQKNIHPKSENKDIQDDILSLTGQWGVKLDPDSIGEKHNYFNSGKCFIY